MIDSINPCAFAVLIILLSYLTSLADRRKMMGVGLAYIDTVFVVYLFEGLGFLIVVQTYEISQIVFTIAAFIVIIAGLLQIGEVLVHRVRFTLSIPESMKTAIDEKIRMATIPSAIVLAGLVSIVELPCSGAIYLAILGLIRNSMTSAEGLPYLLLYNFIFILPLVIILLIVYYGVSPGRVEV